MLLTKYARLNSAHFTIELDKKLYWWLMETTKFPWTSGIKKIIKVAATATHNAKDHVRDQTPTIASSAQASKMEIFALPSVCSQSMPRTVTAFPALNLAMNARDHSTQFLTTVALTATISSLLEPFKNACRRTRLMLVSCITFIFGFSITNRKFQIDTSRTKCLPESRYADSAIHAAQNALTTASTRLSNLRMYEASSVKTCVLTTNTLV